MEWTSLLSPMRYGQEQSKKSISADNRTEFQRDYDRILFSTPFRRLQNKTQVFPLPGGHTMVHNRLTHSLEVAGVGRSLGSIIAKNLIGKKIINNETFYDQLTTIISTACLLHDLGNPPFGHSGEKAITYYFSQGKGQSLKDFVTESQWSDLINFEGNANLLRLLTHQFAGRRYGGYAMTYATLSAMIKYPWGSEVNSKKYGFFQSEKSTFLKIMEQLQIPNQSKETPVYIRNPLVLLVEAADDICYQIMDMEDGCKLGIISKEEVHDIYRRFFDKKKDAETLARIEDTMKEVTDQNEQTAFFRALVIGKLVEETANVFIKNYNSIIEGSFEDKLVDKMNETQSKAMNYCAKKAVEKLYNHHSVVKIEIAGYNVIGFLLDSFIQAILKPGDAYNKELLSLLPAQYQKQTNDNYENIRSVIDFVSGMTDGYAVDLYRKINGIEI